VQVLMGKLI